MYLEFLAPPLALVMGQGELRWVGRASHGKESETPITGACQAHTEVSFIAHQPHGVRVVMAFLWCWACGGMEKEK